MLIFEMNCLINSFIVYLEIKLDVIELNREMVI